MRLAIDVRWLHEALHNATSFEEGTVLPIPIDEQGRGSLGGVGRYVSELLPRLACRLPEARCTLGILRGHTFPGLLHLWPGARWVGLPARWRPPGGSLGPLASLASWLTERRTRRALAPLDLDVFLSPHQLVVPHPTWARHHVVVCHDLAFLQHPHLFFPSGRVPPSYRALYRRLARAERLIAVSSRTASALEEVGVPRDRITVTPEGVNPHFHQDGFRFAPGWPYALCVGSAGPGKNMPAVLEAWEKARARGTALHLVLAGISSGRYAELLKGLRPEDAPAVHRAAPSGDRQLAALYRGATVLLMPSLVEGFGLPALEAMACGCPVITAKHTPMADLVGEAGVVVGPHETDEMAQAIVRVSHDEEFRQRLVEAGLRVSVAYTWERTADLTAAVIRELAGR